MIYEVVEAKRSKRGISIAELARRIGMSGALLGRCLCGKREFRDGEFIKVCKELGLSIADFEGQF